ncbi:MerR family transcriptional regulator [Streptomyces anulatus]|uniref:MerR family transcriptional regulator n=1 Tax=Streptomyces anulatus TaxID=1892 RepID=UPI0034009863
MTVATLRFYEERGLVQHSERRARVRHYRRADLARLAYAQLWHEDGLLTLAETSAIVDSHRLDDRPLRGRRHRRPAPPAPGVRTAGGRRTSGRSDGAVLLTGGGAGFRPRGRRGSRRAWSC